MVYFVLLLFCFFLFCFTFFLSGHFFKGHWRLTGQQGKGGDHLFIPLYHFHPLTNIQALILQLCTWVDYHIFLIAPLEFITLLLWWDLPPYRITIWLIDDVMLIFVCLLVDLIPGFCYSYLTLETGGLELASTTTLVLVAN